MSEDFLNNNEISINDILSLDNEHIGKFTRF